MTKRALEAAYQSLITRSRLRPDPHQQALITRLANLQDELLATNPIPRTIPLIRQDPKPPSRGLYIYGSVGTGKTRLADLFASTLPKEISCRRTHFHSFMNDIHQRLHIARNSPTYTGDPLIPIGKAIYAESRVLCFDEFQLTDIADAMIMRRLFGAIWKAGGVMVSTSNRHPEGLYENGLNRDVVVPFIREVQRRCEVWEVGGKEDYRMSGSGDGKGGMVGRRETFFVDERAFERSLKEVTEGKRLQRIQIPVYGSRMLEVEGVVASTEESDKNDDSATIRTTDASRRFDLVTGSFHQFCERPLSSADYHALCSSTTTLYLSGLRQFQSNEKDFVRRFITLIDLAYEKGTRVICYSNAPLAEVFANIVPVDSKLKNKLAEGMRVKAGGGASSSMMSTFIGETEWSATGLQEASLATGGAGETDVGFAMGRAISRLYEMGSEAYGVRDQTCTG
ncbi:Lactation elevated protein 1 [Cercospora beticola]|uniref:Lactation elevated protein 1 n=1 Tax=Cercospora beticola TaxID=122368 RepID=A0A2G5I2U2_CERBT|nr:Lactation elevated protein 1 [Cercospora beticola]PIA99080.1 Lactation elevated protein 1 [Cercospora beticola]WPB00838.1 hypothetical protein RHO25_005458 [Cercospora beticola]